MPAGVALVVRRNCSLLPLGEWLNILLPRCRAHLGIKIIPGSQPGAAAVSSVNSDVWGDCSQLL